MAEAKAGAGAPRKRSKRMLLLAGVPILALGAGAGAAVAFVPSVRQAVGGVFGGGGGTVRTAEAVRPVFLDIPELTVTMPNAGRARQLRIHLALELAKSPNDPKTADLVNPRVYDSLVLYLRTLRDTEVDGALAIDRLRGDLHRRLDLLLGTGVLRDVLITSLVIG